MPREMLVATALVVLAGAVTGALAAENRNADSEATKSVVNKEPYFKKIFERQSSIPKSVHFVKNVNSAQKGLPDSSNVKYMGTTDIPHTDDENSIPGKEEDEKVYHDIRKDLLPEEAVKTATRMIEEEADRRKKFRSIMRSLVHSELPHLDPKLDYNPEESGEISSKEDDGDIKFEGDMMSRTMSRFSHFLPFLLSRSFQPFSPLQSSLLSRSDSALESLPTARKKMGEFLSDIGNNHKDFSTPRKHPLMLFIPRKSLRIDMTFIPIRGDPTNEKIEKSGPPPRKGDNENPEEKSQSIRVFSSDSASPDTVGSFPFSRLLNFFHGVGDELSSVFSTQTKQDSVTPIPENQTTRRKREIATTEEPTVSTVASRPVPDEPLAATQDPAPAIAAPPTKEDSIRAEPRMLDTDDVKDESPQKEKPTSRMLAPGMDAYGTGVVDDPTRYHPHPFAAFAIPDGIKYPEYKPYFHMMPYYFTGAMLHDKLPIGIIGMMPGMMGSALEQQMVAMNQLAQEASQGAAASMETSHPQAVFGGTPCLSPCTGLPMRSLASVARKKRSHGADAPFQQVYDAARPYGGLLAQRRAPAGPTDRQEFTQTGSNMEDDAFDSDAEPAVVQSKLLLRGEPDVLRKLNPHFKVSFGPEDGERKSDAEREEFGVPKKITKFADKSKSPFSMKKYYRTIPEKKKSKKMLASTGMEPSRSDPLWEVPAFGVNPFVPRMAPSLLGEMETPIAEERMPYRGKRSVSHVQFIHPMFNSEEEQALAALQDDLLTGEGSNLEYLSGLRADGRKGSRRRSKSKPNIFAAPSKTKGKVTEEQEVEIVKIDKNRPDFMPWLDPTMKGDEHDDHFHRKELGNDFKLSSYDH